MCECVRGQGSNVRVSESIAALVNRRLREWVIANKMNKKRDGIASERTVKGLEQLDTHN